MSRRNAIDVTASHRNQEVGHKLRIPLAQTLRWLSFIGGSPLASCLHLPTCTAVSLRHIPSKMQAPGSTSEARNHKLESCCKNIRSLFTSKWSCVYEPRQLLITQNFKVTCFQSLQLTSGQAGLSQMSWKLAVVSARCVRPRQCDGTSWHALFSLKTALGTLLRTKTNEISVAGRRWTARNAFCCAKPHILPRFL
jgi:hypothetical protein